MTVKITWKWKSLVVSVGMKITDLVTTFIYVIKVLELSKINRLVVINSHAIARWIQMGAIFFTDKKQKNSLTAFIIRSQERHFPGLEDICIRKQEVRRFLCIPGCRIVFLRRASRVWACVPIILENGDTNAGIPATKQRPQTTRNMWMRDGLCGYFSKIDCLLR